jgi:3-oxoacyl-[acyl-carrier-protein] synthase II
MSGERRVLICGIGAVTSQGPTADHLWEGVREGRVAIREVSGLAMDGYRTRLGGEVVDPVVPAAEYRRPRGHREPAIDFALRAAEEAVTDAAGLLDRVAPERRGVVVGTCNAGMVSGRKWYARRLAGQEADPELLLLLGPQAIAEALAGALELRGPVLSVNTACAAGAHALGQAADLIRGGRADVVLAGGTDAFCDVLFSGFNSLESLSPAPAKPYSRDRTGLSLGEGAGMLLLVADEVVERADAVPAGDGGARPRVRAELLGYGTSADGYHATAPHPEGEGAARAIAAALLEAGVDPSQVAYVNTHGTGTAKNDVAETRANRRALGEDAARRAALSSTKSMIGHLLGAAGAVEGIVTVRALEEQVAPPTAGYTEPDPECDLDYTPNQARRLTADVAVSNNFAFGGANASVVFARAGSPATTGSPTTTGSQTTTGSPATTAPRARTDCQSAPTPDQVVVTGIGALTPAGTDLDSLLDAWRTGRPAYACEQDGTRAGRIALDITAEMSPRERRRVDRLGLLCILAGRRALADAALAVTPQNRHMIGVVIGTGAGPLESIERFTRGVIEEGATGANPAVFPNTVYNAAGGQVAMHLGTVGPAATVTTGHAAGAAAIAAAAETISRGRACAALAIAADALTDTVLDGYRQLGLIGPDSAMTLSEAGVALLLEPASAARARGARIYGAIAEHAIACDGLGVATLDPTGAGLERAMRETLTRAAMTQHHIGRVWSGISGHGRADAAERAALHRVFGTGAMPRLETPKMTLGEPIGAGGALAAALGLLALHLENGDGRGPALVNSASLGGTNVCLLLTESH